MLLMFSDRVTLEGTWGSDLEDRVDVTERCGEFEPISTARDQLFDNVGTKPLVIKFLHQMDRPDVL